MEIQGTGGVVPEDGNPTEVQSVGNGKGLKRDKLKQAALATGSVESPPDGGEGSGEPSPPGPEYSEASSGQTSTSTTGTSASPADGGQGPDGPVVPPGPAYLESSER